jgi:hypothetical protein
MTVEGFPIQPMFELGCRLNRSMLTQVLNLSAGVSNAKVFRPFV